MIKWIEKLIRVINTHDNEVRHLHSRIAALEKIIKERTNIAVDVGFNRASTVIVIGKYRGVDFVQTYQLRTDTLAELIEHLKHQERYGTVTRIDAPHQFKAAFKWDFPDII